MYYYHLLRWKKKKNMGEKHKGTKIPKTLYHTYNTNTHRETLTATDTQTER